MNNTPEYTLEMKQLLHEQLPTTKHERSKMSHLTEKEWIK